MSTAMLFLTILAAVLLAETLLFAWIAWQYAREKRSEQAERDEAQANATLYPLGRERL